MIERQCTRLEHSQGARQAATTEKAPPDSQCFLQTVIDEIPESLMVIDRDYRIVLANRAARRRNGFGNLVSGEHRCYEVSHHRASPCEGSEHPCPVKSVLESRTSVTVTHTHVDADGSERVMEIVAGPILDERGDVVRVIETMRDVTARVRAEELARKHQAELAHVSRLATMGEMAAGLAHELNQPLSAIVNYTQACLERIRAGSEDSTELLADMERAAAQAERAGEILENIRGFAGKGESRLMPTDLNSLVCSATQLLADRLGRDGVRVDFALANELPPVAAVPIQIEQVIVNLINNSVEALVDANAASRVLSICTSVAADIVEFTIRDSGPGFSADVLEHMFEPFFTTKPSGLGMGLSISWSIIESHGGRLSARRDTEAGATLTFTLPVSDGDCDD